MQSAFGLLVRATEFDKDGVVGVVADSEVRVGERGGDERPE